MANSFQLNAQMRVYGPGTNNIQQIINQINNGLQGRINANVNVNINRQQISRDLNVVKTVNQQISRSARTAVSDMERLGAAAAKTIRQYGAFTIAVGSFQKLTQAINSGIDAFIKYDRELVRVAQVTGQTLGSLKDLSNEVTRLSTTFGVSSEKILESAVTLSQAGLSAKDTKIALEALAKTNLSASFGDINKTTEASIALMQQFGYQAKDLERVLSSINAVSNAFAVESEDIAVAIRRAGGAFQAAGGNLDEFQALFTSVRQTTRESAESIATGFRTIFARLQRVRTQNFLENLGIDVLDDKGLFVGPLKAIQQLSVALNGLSRNDPRFAQITEELGGFRQISKVIPLIEKFDVAQKALNVSIRGGNSLTKDAVVAQESIEVQLTKITEKFQELIRTIGNSSFFRELLKLTLKLTDGFIEMTKRLEGLLPLIAGLGILKIGGNAKEFLKGFGPVIKGGKVRGFNKGGLVPGSGNGDTIPAMLEPGEFVLRKKAVEALGLSNVSDMNRFASGGPVISKKGTKGAVSKSFRLREGIFERTKTSTPIYDFGVASLFPSPLGSLFSTTLNAGKVKDGFPASKVNIHVGSLNDSSRGELLGIFNTNIINALNEGSSAIAKKIGSQKRAFSKNLYSQIGGDAITGALFEGAISMAGAPYDDTRGQGALIDFPKGLGPVGAAFSNSIIGGIPTEAKRTFDKRQANSVIGKIVGFIQSQPQALSQRANAPVPVATGAAQNAFDKFLNVPSGTKITPKDLGGKFKDLDLIRQTLGLPFDVRRGGSGTYFVRRNSGGPIPGVGNTDSVPALLTPGEYVVNKDAAKQIGLANLNRMNNVQKFASGGLVGSIKGAAGGAAFNLAAIALVGTLFSDMSETLNDIINKLVIFGGTLALTNTIYNNTNDAFTKLFKDIAFSKEFSRNKRSADRASIRFGNERFTALKEDRILEEMNRRGPNRLTKDQLSTAQRAGLRRLAGRDPGTPEEREQARIAREEFRATRERRLNDNTLKRFRRGPSRGAVREAFNVFTGDKDFVAQEKQSGQQILSDRLRLLKGGQQAQIKREADERANREILSNQQRLAKAAKSDATNFVNSDAGRARLDDKIVDFQQTPEFAKQQQEAQRKLESRARARFITQTGRDNALKTINTFPGALPKQTRDQIMRDNIQRAFSSKDVRDQANSLVQTRRGDFAAAATNQVINNNRNRLTGEVFDESFNQNVQRREGIVRDVNFNRVRSETLDERKGEERKLVQATNAENATRLRGRRSLRRRAALGRLGRKLGSPSIAGPLGALAGVAGTFIGDSISSGADADIEKGRDTSSLLGIDVSSTTKKGLGKALSFGATGAGIGAQIGSLFGPIGTAVGALGGALVGSITGFISGAEEAEKQLKAVKFGKELENITKTVQRIASGNLSAGNVSGEISGFINKSFDSGIAGNQDLQAQFKTAAPAIETFFDKIAESSSSLDEFNKKSGDSLLKFATLSGIPFNDLLNNYKDQIERQNKVNESIKKFQSSFDETNTVASLLNAFSTSLVSASTKLDALDSSVEALSAVVNSTAPKFEAISSSKIFTAAATGQFRDTAQLSRSASGLLSPFGAEGNRLASFASQANQVKNILPDIIREVGRNPLSGEETSPEDEILKRITKQLGPINPEILRSVGQGITGVIGSEAKPSRLFEQFNQNESQVVEEITKNLDYANEVLAQFADLTSQHNQRISNLYEISYQIQQKTNELELKRLDNINKVSDATSFTNSEFFKNSSAFRRDGSAIARQRDSVSLNTILGTSGQNVDANQLGAAARQAQANLLNINEQMSQAQANNQPLDELFQAQNKNRIELERTTKALEYLADGGNELNTAFEKLAIGAEERRFNRGVLETQTFGSRQDKEQLTRTLAAVRGFQSGSLDVSNLNDEGKQSVLGFLKENANVKFGDKTGQDILTDQMIKEKTKQLGAVGVTDAAGQAKKQVEEALIQSKSEKEAAAELNAVLQKQNSAIDNLQRLFTDNDPLKTGKLQEVNKEFLSQLQTVLTKSLIEQEKATLNTANDTVSAGQAAKALTDKGLTVENVSGAIQELQNMKNIEKETDAQLAALSKGEKFRKSKGLLSTNDVLAGASLAGIDEDKAKVINEQFPEESVYGSINRTVEFNKAIKAKREEVLQNKASKLGIAQDNLRKNNVGNNLEELQKQSEILKNAPSAIEFNKATQQKDRSNARIQELQRGNAATSTGKEGASVASAFDKAVNNFGNITNNLTSNMEKLAGMEMTIRATHDVNVIINGADALAKMTPQLQEMVTGQIVASINKVIDSKFPDVGRVYG